MLKTGFVLAIGLALSVLAESGAGAGVAASRPVPPVRIGVYDCRAIAVAYAQTAAWNREISANMKAMEQAKTAGDGKRVAELKAWGKNQQRRLHRQGFAGAPVDDILAKVKDRLPDIAAKTRVAVITRSADYVASGVEVVDVTDDLVTLFEPSPKTLRTIAELRKHPPLTEEEVENMKD
jgi:hypothetical protein